mmetsp:Transcript_53263/g.158843  ORF Transcript_53263/g.158843 Transcript_53263/m.158843 type:complete len:111 (-) Transcript_53263:620-952(-)
MQNSLGVALKRFRGKKNIGQQENGSFSSPRISRKVNDTTTWPSKYAAERANATGWAAMPCLRAATVPGECEVASDRKVAEATSAKLPPVVTAVANTAVSSAAKASNTGHQ